MEYTNDSELLYLISENNEEAKEMFYKKYQTQIEIIAKKYFLLVKSSGIELNDIIQEGMMGLTEAINNYKDQKNVKFSTFAKICIERKILTYVRANTNTKNKLLNNSLSIDQTISSNGRPLADFLKDENIVNPEDVFINNENKEEIYDKLNKLLTEKEYEVLILSIKGFSQNEISILLNTTVKSVESAKFRAKNKLENILIINNILKNKNIL